MKGALATLCFMLSLTTAGLSVEPSPTAQTMDDRSFQNNQVGVNSFVSNRATEYVLFDWRLYRNTGKEEGDVWDAVGWSEASGRNIGPKIKMVALDPGNENVVYAIDERDHIIKSVNTGKEWITLNATLPGLPVLCLVVNPANSQELFVGTASGLLKSTDAGFSWRPTSFVLPVNQFFVNTQSPSVAYLQSAGVIFVSTDNGNTWKRSDNGLPLVLVRGTGRTASKVPASTSLLVSIPWRQPFLLAATSKGLFRSDDDGGSWKSAGAGLDVSKQFITAAVGKNRITLAAPDALYISTDGLSWTEVVVKSGRNIPSGYAGVIEYPKRGGLLLRFRFSGDPAGKVRIGYLDPTGALVGLNYGVLPHADVVDNLWTGQMGSRLAIFVITTANGAYRDPNDFDNKFVSVFSAGYPGSPRNGFMFASVDGGDSWELLGPTACGTRAAIPKGMPMEIWEYGHPECIARTQNGGLSWTQMPGFDLRSFSASVRTIAFDIQNPNIAYYTAGTNEAYVYRYQYDPLTKQGQSTHLKVVANDVLVNEGNNTILFTDTARLSTDGGWTWTDKSPVLTKFLGGKEPALSNRHFTLTFIRNKEIGAVAVEFDRMTDTDAIIKIIRSRDLGDSWEQVSSLESRASYGNGSWPKVFRNSNDSSNFFVVTFAAPRGRTDRNRADAVKVFETKDDGRTWHEIYSHTVTKGGRPGEVVRAIAQLPSTTGRTLVLGGADGVWKSDGEGKTWKRLGGIQ